MKMTQNKKAKLQESKYFEELHLFACQDKLRSCISRATKGAGAEMRGLKSPLQPGVKAENIQDALNITQEGQGRR